MQAAEEIESLIRARYPLIYVVTSEESRVDRVMAGIAQRWQKQLLEWTCTTGIQPAGTSLQSHKTRNSPTREPLAALDAVIDQVEPAVFVFKDFHPFLQRHQFQVIRRLREIALHLKNSRKTIVFVSPVLEVPAELEKELTVVPFPLPGHPEIAELLDQVTTEVNAAGQASVELDAEGQERLIQSALGLTLNETENVFARLLVRHGRLVADLIGEVLVEKQQIIRKSGLLEYHASDETFGTVGGLDALKDWLVKRASAFSDEARAFGLPAPKGLLLLGVQGCGKSLCAKAAANLWQIPLLRFDVGRVFGSLVGSSEENIRRTISVAESIAPAVLWVDEIDKAFAGSTGSTFSDGGTTARVLGTFLTWLSEKTAPVFVMATANDISQLPPELLRKGRLDEIFFVDLPAETERADILAIHLRKRHRDPTGFDLAALAAASEDFSGAELEEATISALFDAFPGREPLMTRHLLTALGQTVPLARTMAEHIDRLRHWATGRARPASHVTAA